MVDEWESNNSDEVSETSEASNSTAASSTTRPRFRVNRSVTSTNTPTRLTLTTPIPTPTAVTPTWVTQSTSPNHPTTSTTTTPRVTGEATSSGDAAFNLPVEAFDRTLIIEHSNQSELFQMKAIAIKNGLHLLSGPNVVLNPETPRNGCFEIREESGEILLSMLDMEAPFQPLEEMNVDLVISDIIQKLQ